MDKNYIREHRVKDVGTLSQYEGTSYLQANSMVVYVKSGSFLPLISNALMINQRR